MPESEWRPAAALRPWKVLEGTRGEKEDVWEVHGREGDPTEARESSGVA